MKKLPGSILIKLNSRLSKNDILEILAEQMVLLEEHFGIEEFKINSYLEGYIDGKKQAIISTDGDIGIINGFNLSSNSNLENTSKTISIQDRVRTIDYDKSLDTERLNRAVLAIQNENKYSGISTGCKVVSANIAFEAVSIFKQERDKEIHRKYLLRKQEAEQERIKKEREEYEYNQDLRTFIEHKINESALSPIDFKRKISSSCAYLTGRNHIRKYFSDNLDIFEKYKESRLIRLSLKNEKGKVYKIEIYTDKDELLIAQMK